MIELLSAEEMGRADRATISTGVEGLVLMERAGAAVAQEVVRRFPEVRDVRVLCGPGNNGGDGFVAARHLSEAGMQVRLGLLGNRDQLRGDAAAVAALWSGGVEPAEAMDLEGADVVIDALFGAGLNRALDGVAVRLAERVNAASCAVLAVDVPSGVDGTTGQVRGAAIRADITVTFARLKTGHMLLPGRVLCGERVLAHIGITDDVIGSLGVRCFANRPALWQEVLPVPDAHGHKYSRGHAMVFSGGALTTGAARLAARAALRTGAGLVTVAGPFEATAVLAAALEAVMVRRCDSAADVAAHLADRRISAGLIGPGAGVGEDTRARVRALLAAGCATVLDADALTSFAGAADRLAGHIKDVDRPVVLTPHDGEYGRLLYMLERTEPGLAGADRLVRARAAAAYLGACVVLKGADTVVAAPDGRAAIADNAPPWLATAGSGDVLAGIITGLLAQGMPTFEAASAAVWLHGEAGAAAGPGLIAEDLPDALREPLAERMRARPESWSFQDPLR